MPNPVHAEPRANEGANTAWRVAPIDTASEVAWDHLLRTHPMARSIVPTWEVLAGWNNLPIGVYENGVLAGGLVLSTQRIPYTAIALSRINCLMVGGADPIDMLDQLMTYVDGYCLRHLILETELRLRLPVMIGSEDVPENRRIRAALEAYGYRALTKVDTSYFVRIDLDDDTLISSFDRSARNKIRKAERAGAVVAPSGDLALLDDFYEAYVEMCARKKAPPQPEALVGRGLRPLIERGHAVLFTEAYPEGISNLVIVDVLGVPCYVLGTRTRANVRGEVPGAAQVLQFEIMKAMRQRGHTYYDLGGCEGPVPVETHKNFGVWRFKYGFAGEFVRFIPYMRKVRGPFERLARFAHHLRGDFV